MTDVSARGIRLTFDARTGKLGQFYVRDGGQECAPLHRAPWVGTQEVMPDDAAPLMATLGGDFFCAPFAMSEGASGLHGWPANAAWQVEPAGDGQLHATLEKQVHGANLTKELRLIDGHPFVYQRHTFTGGAGRVPVSNHANVSLPDGGTIRTSEKRVWETPKNPQESDPARGRSALRYPAQSEDPRFFPSLEGSTDLTEYPWNSRHEDFVVGIESAGHPLGWTAVVRRGTGELFLSLRNPKTLPMTMLWHSNGGRDYAPWSGRHRDCLGVEEGAADHMLGVSSEADLTGPGAITLKPDGEVSVAHVIGAVHWPTEEPVSDIALGQDSIRIVGESGAERRSPFNRSLLF